MRLEGSDGRALYRFPAYWRRWIAGRASLGVAMVLLSVIPARSQQSKETDLAEKSLEDLMNTQVTSVSKKEQKLSQVAAAIFVITQEDIRRSGATNIPDLLRMVPGMEVAQIDGNTWAISARGFNTQFANKLLVLVDGRTVYSAYAGGVFWDTLDLLLKDIDRIEVIRGPGATVWGANAVNGVINIIPKKSSDTQGGLIAGGAGGFERGFTEGRYGGKLGQQVTYRAFMKYFSRNHLLDVNSQSGDDGWDVLRGGFRADATVNTQNSLTLEGGLYTGTEGETQTSFVSLAPVLQETPMYLLMFREATFWAAGIMSFQVAPIRRCNSMTITIPGTTHTFVSVNTTLTWTFNSTSRGAVGRTSFGEGATALPGITSPVA
ncbi:MAG: TonB-dependent receptor plug domain-containing protein [Candidatus Acidiferrales bacterium]